LTPLHILLPWLLLHWPDLWVDGESRTDDGWVDIWHVSGSLREHVQVLGEKFFESGLLVSRKLCPDPESSFRMLRVHTNQFSFLL